MLLLVVCHSNVTRSVVAAQLLTDAMDARGIQAEVRTAGTHAGTGQPVSPRTRRAFALAGGDDGLLAAHRSRPVGVGDLESADLVVTMEASQARLLRSRHPPASSRIGTLRYLANALPGDARPLTERVATLGLGTVDFVDADDVVDPAGGDDDAYVACVGELAELCEALADRLHPTR